VIDSWYLDNLVCPIDHTKLKYNENYLICNESHKYPIINKIPIMLIDGASETLNVMTETLKITQKVIKDEKHIDSSSDLFLDTLGITEEERQGITKLACNSSIKVDPVVSYLIAATNGIMYKHLIGKLKNYPIPELPLEPEYCGLLLDMGCSWGRWCIAADSKGFNTVGLDPSLGAIMAAKRVSKQLGTHTHFVVGDARWLPFKHECFRTVLSYSVLQHFSYEDARQSIGEVSRVLKKTGMSVIQLPNVYGVRCFYHQAKRNFRIPEKFEVRYWSPKRMRKSFNSIVGKTSLNVDGFFGLGVQSVDIKIMHLSMRLLIMASEYLKKMSKYFKFLVYFSDSIWVVSRKE